MFINFWNRYTYTYTYYVLYLRVTSTENENNRKIQSLLYNAMDWMDIWCVNWIKFLEINLKK